MINVYSDADTLSEVLGLLEMGDKNGIRKLRELLKSKLAEIHKFEKYVDDQDLAVMMDETLHFKETNNE